jgi:hypothetical protein
MRTLVTRASTFGVVVIMAVGLSLAAIVEQALLPAVHSAHRQSAAPKPKPTHKRPHPTHASRSAPRPSPQTLLSRQVKLEATAKRAAVAKREYGVKKVSTPVVHVSRIDKAHTWAFGTEAIPAPATSTMAAPESSVFIARASGTRWTVALAGTPQFKGFVDKAPTSVLPKDQRETLKKFDSMADLPKANKGVLDTGLMLPWTKGQSWSALSTDTGTWGFSGGDGRVVAAGDGRLYRLCSSEPDRGLVMLIHPNGLATEYYQLKDVTPVPDGTTVKQGDYLGRTGGDEPCGGGDANRSLVRFAVRNADEAIPLNNVEIGGWTLHSDAKAMFAERAGLHVDVGNPLLNFGDMPAPTPSPSGKSPRIPEMPPAEKANAAT